MKLCLFLSHGEGTAGIVTDRGVVDASPVVRKGHTPQLTMQGLIDGYEGLKPALEKLAKEGNAVPLDTVRLLAPLPRPGKILASWLTNRSASGTSSASSWSDRASACG